MKLNIKHLEIRATIESDEVDGIRLIAKEIQPGKLHPTVLSELLSEALGEFNELARRDPGETNKL